MGYKILWAIFVMSIMTRGIAGDGTNPFARIGESSQSSGTIEANKNAEIAANKSFEIESNLDAGNLSKSAGINKSAEISANKSVQLDSNLNAGAGDPNANNANGAGGGNVISNAFNRLSDIFSLNGNGNANAGVNADFHVGSPNDGQVVNFGSPDNNSQPQQQQEAPVAVDNSSTTTSTSTTPAPGQSPSTESIIVLTTPAPTLPTTTVWPTSPRPKSFYPYPYPEQRPVSPKFPNSNSYHENNNAIDNPQDC